MQLCPDFQARALDCDVKKDGLESWRTYERFMVVDAGGGQLAFYSPLHRRFLKMYADGRVGADPHTDRSAGDLPHDWPCERFTAVNAGEGRVALHNPRANRFLRLTQDLRVDGYGGPMDATALPPYEQWPTERFEVVVHSLQVFH